MKSGLERLAKALRRLWKRLREQDGYKPEVHYMRGPGPRTRAAEQRNKSR